LLLPKKDTIFADEMMKKLCLTLISIFLLQYICAQNVSAIYSQSSSREPLHEMRAVWLTTIGGLDWPHSYAQSPTSIRRQQRELCSILDKLSAAGVNTVLLQTRVRATTIFASPMEPWDGCLSGFPGKSPGYDALAFAIEECHKRGMKLHAWVVSIPVGRWNGEGCRYLRKTVPELLIKIDNEGFMNPEKSGTADYLARFCADITQRYDIDGIHLDYIRYPETWRFPQIHYKCQNYITHIVKTVHDAVKAEKPWVMMSCSPVGKYADTQRQWSHGWNARDIVFQDAALWLEEGYMDAIFPMMYFRGNNFYPFAIDWLERSSGRIVAPGLGIYFLDKKEKDWPLEDITREMHVLRQYGMGNCLFRSKFFTDNVKGLYDYVSSSFAKQPALVPAMSWYETSTPIAPDSVKLEHRGDGTTLLSWQVDSILLQQKSVGNRRLLYNVYGSTSAPVDTKDASNLLMAAFDGQSIVMPTSATVRYYAVTSVDCYGNESVASQSYNGVSNDREDDAFVYLATFFQMDHGVVWLDNAEVADKQLLEVCSIIGNAVTSSFVRTVDGRKFVDVTDIPAGHYVINVINKKGYRHRLGMFSVEIP